MEFEIIALPHTPDCRLLFCERFLPLATAQQYFDLLHHVVAWQQETILVYGNTVASPRMTAWYGDTAAHYRYSGIDHTPLPWIAPLAELKQGIETALSGWNHPASFNSVLLNLYRSGQDSVGWHSDNEAALGLNPVIASLSLGATRTFHLKPRTSVRSSRDHIKLELPAGSLLLMAGATQHHWKHAILKEGGVTEPRINLTFRRVTPVAGTD